MDQPLNQQRKRQVLLAIGLVVIIAASIGVLFDKLKTPSVNTTTTSSGSVPDQPIQEGVSLQERTIYLGSYNKEDVLYFTSGSNSSTGTVVTKSGSSVKDIYFTKMDGISTLYTIPENLYTISNFGFSEDKNLIFAALVTDDTRLGKYPDNLVNKIYRISMKNLTGSVVWSSNLKSNTFNANGAAKIEAVGGNSYLVVSILKCMLCASNESTSVLINTTTKSEKVLGTASDFSFDLVNKTLSFKKSSGQQTSIPL